VCLGGGVVCWWLVQSKDFRRRDDCFYLSIRQEFFPRFVIQKVVGYLIITHRMKRVLCRLFWLKCHRLIINPAEFFNLLTGSFLGCWCNLPWVFNPDRFS
jgi:hypothetical protein